MATSNKLFVYGTLRRGFSLNRLLRRSGARFASRGKIRARLFDLGEYPGVSPALKSTDFVEGELYQLTSPTKQLAILDQAEEFDLRHPKTSLFRRRLVDVHLADGRKQRAWVYFLNRKTRSARLVPRGDYALAGKRGAISQVRS